MLLFQFNKNEKWPIIKPESKENEFNISSFYYLLISASARIKIFLSSTKWLEGSIKINFWIQSCINNKLSCVFLNSRKTCCWFSMISSKATRSRGFFTARGRAVQHLIVRLQAHHKHEKDDRFISNPWLKTFFINDEWWWRSDVQLDHHGLKGPCEVIMIRHDRVCLHHEAVKKLYHN